MATGFGVDLGDSFAAAGDGVFEGTCGGAPGDFCGGRSFCLISAFGRSVGDVTEGDLTAGAGAVGLFFGVNLMRGVTVAKRSVLLVGVFCTIEQDVGRWVTGLTEKDDNGDRVRPSAEVRDESNTFCGVTGFGATLLLIAVVVATDAGAGADVLKGAVPNAVCWVVVT